MHVCATACGHFFGLAFSSRASTHIAQRPPRSVVRAYALRLRRVCKHLCVVAGACSCIQPLNLMKQLNWVGPLGVTYTIYTFYMYDRCSRNVWCVYMWHPYPYYVSRRRTCTHTATVAAHGPTDVHRTNRTGPNVSSWSAPIFFKK
jgi:hypothetical protein